MPITIRCPHCSAPSTVKDKYAGKKVCCPECSSAFRVRTRTPDPAAQTPRPRTNAASPKAFVQARSPLPPAPPRNSLKERRLARKDSGLYLRPRLRRWSSRRSELLVAAIFTVGLLLGIGIVLAWMPSRPKAETTAAGSSLPRPTRRTTVWVQADSQGQIDLVPAAARVRGIKEYFGTAHAVDGSGDWDDSIDYIAWDFEAPATGSYRVEITYACPAGNAGSTYCIRVGQGQLSGTVQATGGWANFRTEVLQGQLNLQSGKYSLRLWAMTVPNKAVMGLQKVRLIAVH